VNEEAKVQAPASADKAKLAIAVLLVVGGIVAFYAMGDAPSWQRWGAVVLGLVLALAIVGASRYGRATWQFVLDSRVELRKIVWPTQRETGMTTLVVFAFVIIGGVFFWFVDLVLAWATRHLTGQGG
jgi:preprotein translocase subunit SecE